VVRRIPDAEQNKVQTRNPKSARRRMPERRKKLRSKRQELSQIVKELHVAKRGAEISEQIEQVKRTKKKKQEIFRLRNEISAAKLGAKGELGALPDFIVIGAAKCGTTFFYHLLTKHPQVEPAAFKELQYFNLLFQEGTEWYRQCFPSPKLKNGRRTITGEGTPGYLFHPQVPERMIEVVPRARLIALLRNPVDRTYSAYHHRARNRQLPRTFEETVEAAFDAPDRGFLSQSIYVDHLLRWSEFFPGEQMLVLKSEDFFEHPRETLKLVLDFLDLPDWGPEASELRDRVNKGGYKQRMDPAIRRRLEEFFEPHNRRLYEYLGMDFGW
jgi:Sulfotransferase domain